MPDVLPHCSCHVARRDFSQVRKISCFISLAGTDVTESHQLYFFFSGKIGLLVGLLCDYTAGVERKVSKVLTQSC